MAIPTITGYTGVIPDRRTQSAEEFTSAAVTWTDYQAATLVPSANAAINGINAAQDEILASVNNAEESSFIAQAAANYQGPWFSGAPVVKGESWSHNGLMWAANVNGAGEPQEGAQWFLLKSEPELSAIKVMLEQWGYRYAGLFDDGFTYSQVGDAGVDANNDAWFYVGAGAPNKSVSAGTVPSAPDYERVIFNDHSKMVGRDDVGAHDSIYRRKTDVAEIMSGVFSVGDMLEVKDRYGARFDVVSGGTPNGRGVIDAGNGNTAIAVHGSASNILYYGADPTGTADSYEVVQGVLNGPGTPAPVDGTFKLDSQVSLTKPNAVKMNGSNTKFVFSDGFSASCFRISPDVGVDPKNWSVGDFNVTAPSTAVNVFLIDISTAGKYVSKLTVENIVSTAQTAGNFVELTNTIPNIDGLFTSVFKDNWSFGGYYMENVGDSVYFLRNTTTGAGYGYYVNELGTAANITIRDGNCTVSGNALYCVKGSNITFDNMQVECPLGFTGLGNACVYFDHSGGSLVFNNKITNNNINTQGNPLYPIRLQETDLTIIDGNNLYCDITSGAHIRIDESARNTIIGNNKYFNWANGNEISPIIIDNGIGTVGIWKDATITLTGWSSQNTATEHPLGFIKSEEGIVTMRGRVAGAPSSATDTILTLPEGFRPKDKAYVLGAHGVNGSSTSVILQVLPTGQIQTLNSGVTSVYFTGISFSTK